MHNLVDGLAGSGGSRAAGATLAGGRAAAVLALRDFDAHGIAAEILAVQLLDHRFGSLLIFDICKAEAAASAGVAVVDGLETHSFTHGTEQSLELLGIKGLRQVADVEANAHGEGGRKTFCRRGEASRSAFTSES